MADELSRDKLLGLEKELKLQIFDLDEQTQFFAQQARERRATLSKVRAQIQHIDSLPTPKDIQEALGDTGEGEDTQDDADPPAEV